MLRENPKGEAFMSEDIPLRPIAIGLVVAVAIVVAGSFAIGFWQTLTLLAVAATFAVFYLLIHGSRA